MSQPKALFSRKNDLGEKKMSDPNGLFSILKNDLGEKNCHNLMVYFLPKKEKRNQKATSQEKVACVVAIWKQVCNLPILPRIRPLCKWP